MEQTWSEWFWRTKRQPMKDEDAAHDPVLRAHFSSMLDGPENPEWIKASEIAEALPPKELWRFGYTTWMEMVPAIKELAFDMRAMGVCEIRKNGKLVPEDVSAYEVEGGIRIRRKAEM